VDRHNGTLHAQAAGAIPDHDLMSDLLSLPAEKVHETLANYSLRDLGTMTEHELRQAGLTPARARKLRTAFELAKRFQNGKPVLRGQPFSTPRQIFDAYHVRFRDEKREHFLIITLDARHRVMNEHLISIGSLTSSTSTASRSDRCHRPA